MYKRQKYRFIALTQRYFGTGPWKDDGREFSVATFADDLAKFVTSLNAGPVHLVGWSFGGHVAATMAVKNPSLVRSLVLYEASMMSVLPADSAEGKAAREDRARIFAPAAAASKAGDPVKASNTAAYRGAYAEFQISAVKFDDVHAPVRWLTAAFTPSQLIPKHFKHISCGVIPRNAISGPGFPGRVS